MKAKIFFFLICIIVLASSVSSVLEYDLADRGNNTYNINPTYTTLEGVQNKTDVNFIVTNTTVLNATAIYGDISKTTGYTEPLSLHLSMNNWYNDTNSWIYFLDNIITFNESKLATEYFNATTVNATRGISEGDITHIQNYDNIAYNVTEIAGADGLDLRINFTGITKFNIMKIRYKSTLGESHILYLQIYDYVIEDWENYYTLSETDDYVKLDFTVDDYTDHLQGDGIVQVRFYQNANGNINHKHLFDQVILANGYATPSGTEIDPFWHNEKFNYYNTTEIDLILSSNITVINNNLTLIWLNLTTAQNNITQLWVNVSDINTSLGLKLESGDLSSYLQNGTDVNFVKLNASELNVSNGVQIGGGLNATGDVKIDGNVNIGGASAVADDVILEVRKLVTVDYSTAIIGQPQLSGIHTNAYGIWFQMDFEDGDADVTNSYSNYIANPASVLGAGVTNNYGLYIEDMTRGGTLNYGIYSAGGDNYFAGDVGIGTANPSHTLNVDGTMNVTGISYLESDLNLLGGSAVINAPDGYLQFTTKADSAIYNDLGGIFYIRDKDDGNEVRLYLDSSNGYFNLYNADAGNYFRLSPTGNSFYIGTGNVGIGTSTPNAKLHVAGTNDDTGLMISGTSTYQSSGIEFIYNPAAPDTSHVARIMPDVQGGGGGGLIFQTALDANDPYLSKMEVLRSGNVNITTGNLYVGNHKVNLSSTGDVNATKFYGDGSALANLPSGGADSPWKITDGILYNLTGNVGIGADTPSQKLVVAGDVNVTGAGTFEAVNTTELWIIPELGIEIKLSEDTGFLTVSGGVQLDDGNVFAVGAAQGITDTTSYWLCTAADCSSTCQVYIEGGIIYLCI